eukprot:197893_1
MHNQLNTEATDHHIKFQSDKSTVQVIQEESSQNPSSKSESATQTKPINPAKLDQYQHALQLARNEMNVSENVSSQINSVGDNRHVSDRSTGGKQVVETPVDGASSGDESAGDESAGDESAGDESAGNLPTPNELNRLKLPHDESQVEKSETIETSSLKSTIDMTVNDESVSEQFVDNSHSSIESGDSVHESSDGGFVGNESSSFEPSKNVSATGNSANVLSNVLRGSTEILMSGNLPEDGADLLEHVPDGETPHSIESVSRETSVTIGESGSNKLPNDVAATSERIGVKPIVCESIFEYLKHPMCYPIPDKSIKDESYIYDVSSISTQKAQQQADQVAGSENTYVPLSSVWSSGEVRMSDSSESSNSLKPQHIRSNTQAENHIDKSSNDVSGNSEPGATESVRGDRIADSHAKTDISDGTIALNHVHVSVTDRVTTSETDTEQEVVSSDIPVNSKRDEMPKVEDLVPNSHPVVGERRSKRTKFTDDRSKVGQKGQTPRDEVLRPMKFDIAILFSVIGGITFAINFITLPYVLGGYEHFRRIHIIATIFGLATASIDIEMFHNTVAFVAGYRLVHWIGSMG